MDRRVVILRSKKVPSTACRLSNQLVPGFTGSALHQFPLFPHPSSLIPHPSSFIPHSSFCILHSSFLHRWPILSLEIHSPFCYAHRSVPLVFFGNSINENLKLETSAVQYWHKSWRHARLRAFPPSGSRPDVYVGLGGQLT